MATCVCFFVCAYDDFADFSANGDHIKSVFEALPHNESGTQIPAETLRYFSQPAAVNELLKQKTADNGWRGEV